VTTAKPLPLEADEPQRVAEATRRMKLRHVVITAVARDDIADGGAEHFRQTIEAVRRLNPKTVIEVLVSDFQGSDASIETVLSAPEHFQPQFGNRPPPDAGRAASRDLRPFVERAAKGEGPGAKGGRKFSPSPA
jgi:hypothetical protein